MEEEKFVTEEKPQYSGSRGVFWLTMCAFLFLAAAGAALVYYSFQQKATIGELSSQESGMNATISQLQTRLDTTTTKLNDVTAAQAATAEAAANAARNVARSGSGGLSKADANRLKDMQTGLDNQQKQLQATQDDVTQTRSDLEGSLSSTKDELNGSIAKTHDELVLLEKTGARNYFEFDAAKSKRFQHTGPLGISLRRIDPKHDNVDMMVLVNDREISKKKVNLYEPVWIFEDQNAQPVQVVVNKIDKNGVHGYISAPKYTPEDLAAGTTHAPATVAPSTGTTDTSSPE